MGKPLDLQRVRIASPCPVRWDDMQGSDRVRFCAQCRLNVYNFAELRPEQIEVLLQKTEERICAQLRRRADGTMITRDCPVGLRRVRIKLVAAFATAVGLVLSLLSFARRSHDQSVSEVWPQAKALTTAQAIAAEDRMRGWPYVGAVIEWLDPASVAPPPTMMMGGEVAVMPAPTPPPPAPGSP